MSEWRSTTVGDYCPFTYGKGLPKSKREKGSVPVFGSNGKVGYHSKSFVTKGGVIIGRKGSVGAVHYSKASFWPIDTAFFISTGDSLEDLFIFYMLGNLGLSKMNSDSAVPGLNRDNAHSLKIRIPENLEDRQLIAHILSSLDDKIALNRKLNATLEAMAQALFQSWFVDFDPVKAKLAAVRCGRDPEQAAMAAIACKLIVPPGKPKAETLDAQLPRAEAIDAAIASLDELSEAQRQSLKEKAAHFPSDFQESELGLIPQGWEVTGIYECAEVIYGAAFASKQFNSDSIGLPLIRIRDLKSEKPQAYTEQIHKKGHKVKPGDILVGMDGEFRAHLWGGEEGWLNQRICKFKPIKAYNSCYVRFLLKKPLQFIEATEVATTVIHLGKSDIDQFKVIRAPSYLASVFSFETDAYDRQIISNKIQSRTLANLRDALLPKLLSGEISVSPN